MGRMTKSGHKKMKRPKGEAGSYLTRCKAIKRTQLPLSDFRRMCILKGIYPRDPKRKYRGADQTYYHVKDIGFLNRDPLMAAFRAGHAFDKKVRRALGRNEKSIARHLLKNKPTYSLHHLVKERYPTLVDAIRDLDDPLSTLALFASLPADNDKDIPSDAINESIALLDEFHFIVADRGMLRRTFASIKGYYFQAEILGQLVTWLVPHSFSQQMPYEVDFSVMLTFLEFYRTLLKFINFKLYNLQGYAYPPLVDQNVKIAGGRQLALTAKSVIPKEPTEGEDVSMMGEQNQLQGAPETSEGLKLSAKSLPMDPKAALFGKFVFFINREVPLLIVSFLVRSGGAHQIGWDGDGSPFDVDFPSITHHVVDRNTEQLDLLFGSSAALPARTFVQPQWVFDSFNTAVLLPTAPYAPGKSPPPHLSPFVDDLSEGYIPRQREILNELSHRTAESSGKDGLRGLDDVSENEDDVDAFEENIAIAQKFQREIEAEMQGEVYSQLKKTEADDMGVSTSAVQRLNSEVNAELSTLRKRAKKKLEEETERRKKLMSNRKRKLREKMEEEESKKKKKAAKLRNKASTAITS